MKKMFWSRALSPSRLRKYIKRDIDQKENKELVKLNNNLAVPPV
ncbi:hypothetical protein [Bacillus subtilis]|nr:hypothetical protein [Bacillus subtilis]UUH70159.1 hypothetical protein NP434_18925 [Bacillus subtilis subsp. subtilis]UUH82180.1 hypothetical protein NP433_18925 [Bacillus subtilis]UUI48644.1 hypothetical protein NP432_18925 [Bacillus subtilis]